MRKKMIGVIIFLLALCFLTVGIMQAQYASIPFYYDQMASIP